MKKKSILYLVSALLLTLSACAGETVEFPSAAPVSASETGAVVETVVEQNDSPQISASTISVDYDSDDLDAGTSGSMSTISLEGNAITVDGSGATVDGNVVTITSSGTYDIHGTLYDGQIVVDTQDQETVRLILTGVDIACSTSAPIYMVNAEKTVITLADGTDNVLTDGDTYILADAESNEPNAAVFSNDDLTINGNGSLTVNANYNNGIASDDDLKITGGHITVNAANDGIKGRDSIAVEDGTITIIAASDGMQASNDEDAEEGYIVIEGGTFDITAGTDGIQAETVLVINGGQFTISTGGGSVNSSSGNNWGGWGMGNNTGGSGDGDSAKGLKAGVDVTITGGTFNIDSSDDAIHSNDTLTIDDGSITIASGDDGIHSDTALQINGGDIRITKSYEGIESAAITINDGSIHIVSSDDGINAAGGNDGSSIDGRPGQNPFNANADCTLQINGGYIVSDALGDGIDINGSIAMSGGTVIIHGPTENNNGPLDYLGTFEMTGGLLVGAGSSGMAQAPSTSSTQYSVLVAFPSALPAGTMVHIEAENGEEILTFVPTKTYQSVVLCSPELENGSTYVVYTGGSSTGTAVDGLYSGGTYAAGTQSDSFTVSSMVTGVGSYGGGFPGGPGGGRPGDRRP